MTLEFLTMAKPKLVSPRPLRGRSMSVAKAQNNLYPDRI
jgi:hypothetical protein